MYGVTAEHIAVVGTLVLMEGLLSADNAIVLAVQVKPLPRRERRRALLYGVAGALILRAIAIRFARQIVGPWWVCGLGAIYLLTLSLRHFRPNMGAWLGLPSLHLKVRSPAAGRRSFWQTVLLVEITDFFFAIDSLLVAIALSPNIWVLYVGAAIGILLMRLSATAFIRLLDRYPSLENLAYVLVAWAAVKLGALTIERFLIAIGRFTRATVPNLMPIWLFWPVMAAIVVCGAIMSYRRDRSKAEVGKADIAGEFGDFTADASTANSA